MALPTLADKIDAIEDKLEKESIISEIANAVFKSAKISTEAAAKFAVVPSVPQMVDDILEDLKSGSILKFNQAMDKLDKLVRTLGIDLKKYNKELANFAEKREEKIIKSEQKIQTLREKNIVAQIEKSGDIKILSQKEIETKKDDLKKTEKRIRDLEKKIEKDRKQIQDPGIFDKKLKTTAQFNKKEEIKRDTEELEKRKKERDKAKETLGDDGEEPRGIIQNVRGGMDTVADYLPDQLVELGSAFKEGLMAPFTAIQELGMQFGQLLKPLKLLRPLFKGIIGSLKKFALALKASVVAFLPYLAIAGLVVLALGGLYLMLKKAKEFFSIGDGGEGSASDMAAEAAGVGIGDENNVAEEGTPKKTRTYVYDPDTNKLIMGDDPRYDEVYKKVTGKEPPKKNEYIIDGERKILPMTDDGQLIKSGNFMDPKNRTNLQVPEGLKPVDTTKSGDTANVNNVSQVSNVSNANYTSSGLNGANNKDLDAFALAQKYVSV